MAKKSRLRRPIHSEQVKGYETPQKYIRQYFSHFFWSLRKKIPSKNSVLVVSQILRLFLNILTPDDKHSLSVKASV